MSKRALSITALNRLKAEERNLLKDSQECGFTAHPQKHSNGCKDYSTWDIFIKGSQDSLYEGTVLHAVIEFDMNYPLVPPRMRFISRMFHPNIYSDGKVCISILHVANNDDDPSAYELPDEKWTPVHGIRTIVLGVISILNEPNPVSPANVDASKLFNENRAEYDRKVKEIVLGQRLKRSSNKEGFTFNT